MVSRLLVLTAGKGEQGRVIAGVGGLQGGDVGLPRRTGIDQVAAAPGETGLTQPHDQQIGEQARMPPIAIGERVNGDQAVMQADGDLVRRQAGVFDLIAHVVEQLSQFDADSEPVDADVLVFNSPCVVMWRGSRLASSSGSSGSS